MACCWQLLIFVWSQPVVRFFLKALQAPELAFIIVLLQEGIQNNVFLLYTFLHCAAFSSHSIPMARNFFCACFSQQQNSTSRFTNSVNRKRTKRIKRRPCPSRKGCCACFRGSSSLPPSSSSIEAAASSNSITMHKRGWKFSSFPYSIFTQPSFSSLSIPYPRCVAIHS